MYGVWENTDLLIDCPGVGGVLCPEYPVLGAEGGPRHYGGEQGEHGSRHHAADTEGSDHGVNITLNGNLRPFKIDKKFLWSLEYHLAKKGIS